MNKFFFYKNNVNLRLFASEMIDFIYLKIGFIYNLC